MIKRLCEDYGTWIKISDVNHPKRIVTLPGTTITVKAFTMIVTNLEENTICSKAYSMVAPRALVTITLTVPSIQLGFLIKNGGYKIKEIHKSSGDQVLDRDMLPNSSQRDITIAGLPQCVTERAKQICQAMKEMFSKFLEVSSDTFIPGTLGSSPYNYRSSAYYY